MPKKLSETKSRSAGQKASKTVEEKIQEFASVKEPENVAPPQVMQVVEVTEEPIVAEEKLSEAPPTQDASAGKEESVVSEFFSPSKESSSVGYPNISMHKKSMTPIILWAAGVCILVVAIGVGIITISKGTFPI
ncbi:MAG: hypothetical protein Q7U68_04625, partial [Candidatus Roizmanbacteria bacterium]|nr:hypothetical protein [Candidatus Roizmanbacteria bacterium]